MVSTPTLATRFTRNARVLRTDIPLTEEQMRAAAPSIFAEGKHASRSERYTDGDLGVLLGNLRHRLGPGLSGAPLPPPPGSCSVGGESGEMTPFADGASRAIVRSLVR